MIKNSKIKHIVLGCLIAFASFILLFLFLMQIVFLNKYYEIYKKNQLDNIVSSIKNTNSMNISILEDYAYNYGVCISIYSNGVIQTISNTYNKGCLFSDKSTSDNYITSFVESGSTEDTRLLYNKRFGNKTIIKALKYNDEVYIFLNTSIQPLDSSIILLKSQYGYIALIIFGISLIISYVISSMISKPIVKISDSAKKLANGDFNVSFSTNSKVQEIKELSTTLDLAKNELSKTDELRRDLMANVGHDLRTPLTMIKAYAEMTRDLESQTPEKRAENMNIIIEETDRLNVLVSDILDLSKLQSSTYELKIEEFDLDELIKNIIKRFYILIDSDGYEFIYNNDKKIMVKADKKRLEQVIYNLLNNAVNYTGEDKKIYINITEDKKKILVEIKDTGKGIDKEEIKYIWNKYYHNEKKHKRNAFGTGLGLSIVKTILESHNYKYGVKSIKNHGTTFYFEIDKKNML